MTLTTTTATLTAVLLVPLALTVSNHGEAIPTNGQAGQIATAVEQPSTPPVTLALADIEEANHDHEHAEGSDHEHAEHDAGQIVSKPPGEFNEEEKRIDESLKKKVSLHFENATIAEVMAQVALSSKINVVLDDVGMREEGITCDTPISINVDGIRLRSALNLILKPMNLGFLAEHEVLKITSLARISETPAHDHEDIESGDALDLQFSNSSDDSATEVVVESSINHLRAKGLFYKDGSLVIGDIQLTPRQWDFRDQPATVQRIERALENSTRLEFVDTPLVEAVDYISQQHGVAILIDELALTDVGVPTDEPINLIVSDIKLDSALNLMLRNLELDYIIRDEVLTITAAEVAEGTVDTRVYDIRQLPQASPPELAELIQQTDSPPMPCTPIDGAIVATHNRRGHRQIVDLLEQLLRHTETDGSARQHSSVAPGIGFQLSGVPWGDREKTTLMYDIRELIERYDGFDAASDEISRRAKPLGVKWGGGIIADHLIAVTTPEQHEVLRKIIDRMLDEEAGE